MSLDKKKKMILRIVVHITAMSLLWENFVEQWEAQFYHQFNEKISIQY